MTAPCFRYNCTGPIWVSGLACDGISITHCVLVTGEKCVLREGGVGGAVKGMHEKLDYFEYP